MYYYLNPRRQIFILQVIVLIALCVIIAMIYSQYSQGERLSESVGVIKDNSRCPDVDVVNQVHPTTPAPRCPQVNCPSCPSVKDIVGGIFPGRNTGVTSGGRYFDVKMNEDYDLMPDYSFYNAKDAFPDDMKFDIDPPLRSANVHVDQNDINNSIDNENVDTNSSASVHRMAMGSNMKEQQTHPKMRQSDSSTFKQSSMNQ